MISADGRYVVFATSATNLAKGDRNQSVDIFIRDRLAGTTERASMAGRNTEANGESSHPAISPDGRFIAYSSYADNLVPGDTNAASDVFVLDRQAATTERVSVNSAQQEASNSSGRPAVSADGRYVAFVSSASNLVAGDDDGASDVFLRDRQAGTTEGVSVVPVEFGNTSTSPAISADGRHVAFRSFANNLVGGDGNFDYDIFVHDRATHTTVRASVRTDGTEGGLSSGSHNASISADGHVIAFDSEAALVAEDTEFPVDIFVHDER